VQCLDFGTGSGCIPLALKAKRPLWTCTGVDVSTDALKVANGNAKILSLNVDFKELDVLQNPALHLRLTNYNIIVSNPPYIPPSERDLMGPSTLAHEPESPFFVPEGDSATVLPPYR